MKKKILLLTIFGISFGLIEAAVVIYAREIFYPAGFSFPLALPPDMKIFPVELIREIGTLVLLYSVAALLGKNFREIFAYFLFSFAVWDIFYYVFLKIFLNWPPSLLTWDLLFLLPWAWVGPVLAPLACSAAMIFMSQVLLRRALSTKSWILIISGSVIILFSFLRDFGKILFSDQPLLDAVSQFVPQRFLWGVFLIGYAAILCGLIFFAEPRNSWQRDS